MAIVILSPSAIPASRARSGALYVRVAKNTVHFSTALCEAMGLGIGCKVLFQIKDGTLEVFKTDLEDAYVLRGKRNDLYFSYSSLCAAILEHFHCSSILEKEIANSVKFDVDQHSGNGFWAIVPPKKLERT